MDEGFWSSSVCVNRYRDCPGNYVSFWFMTLEVTILKPNFCYLMCRVDEGFWPSSVCVKRFLDARGKLHGSLIYDIWGCHS